MYNIILSADLDMIGIQLAWSWMRPYTSALRR